ncbi:MAG: hypothetical protein ACRDO1_00105 [Nocardioidaceae bacterium]
MDADVASDCIRELRARTRSPAQEYKASVVLRERNRAALCWLLGPTGPLPGHAHVHLTEKSFFVVGGAVDLLVGGSTDSVAAMAAQLHQQGPGTFGRDPWSAFLAAFNDLIRAKSAVDVATSAGTFFRLVDGLRLGGADGRVGELMARLSYAEADSLLGQLLDTTRMDPLRNPLFPAIVHAVGYWGAGGRPVSIVHDVQHALTAERIAHLQEISGTPRIGRLAGVRLVDSRSDPRVQVADLLAGAARRIASDALNGSGDAELLDLLSEYVDHDSIWGDQRSWARLAPSTARRRLPNWAKFDLGPA